LHAVKSSVLRDMGQAQDAMDAAREALRLDPDDPDNHVAVGLSAVALGERAEGLAQLEAARSLDPSNARLHRLVGDRHLDLADNLAAERAYRQALALQPNDALALNNLGCALLAQKRKTEATLAFKSALLLDPSMSAAKRNTHGTMRGLVGSSTTLGVVGLVAASLFKFKVLWLWLLARTVFLMPKPWLVLVAVPILGVATLLGWRLRLYLLARRDPQLIAIFRQLERDHKAKRL